MHPVDLNGGAFVDGDLVQITAPNGQFLTAVGGGGALLANVSTPGDFETFAISTPARP